MKKICLSLAMILTMAACAQNKPSPQAEECISTFEELSLTTDNVDDFRMGN